MTYSPVPSFAIVATACALVGAVALATPAPAPPTSGPASSASPSDESFTRTVEDGGTGPLKPVLVGDRTLPTHTVFRPKDLTAFGEKRSGLSKVPGWTVEKKNIA